jgi:hypothetical protein
MLRARKLLQMLRKNFRTKSQSPLSSTLVVAQAVRSQISSKKNLDVLA